MSISTNRWISIIKKYDTDSTRHYTKHLTNTAQIFKVIDFKGQLRNCHNKEFLGRDDGCK